MHRAAQALLLAVRLWPVMPEELRASCQLLPAGAAAPPKGFFTGSSGGASKKKSKALTPDGAAGAAASFFTTAHLQSLLPVLRLTSGAHPRLHSLWPTLLALLLPGFSADRVRCSHHPRSRLENCVGLQRMICQNCALAGTTAAVNGVVVGPTCKGHLFKQALWL